MPLEDPDITRIQQVVDASIQQERTANLAAVSVKLPQFWPDRARYWFAIAEANFETSRITSKKTKFNYVVMQLDQKTASRLMDVIENPGEEDPYKALKDRLLESFELTDRERASRILDWTGLGDRRPSQCLEDMILVMPRGLTDLGILFKEQFLRQLAPEVRAHLAQSTNMKNSTVDSLRRLAKEADHYYESTGARINALSNETEAISLGPSAPIDSDPAWEADHEISAISNRGGYAPQGARGGFGSRGRGGNRGGARNQFRQCQAPQPITICRYHAQWGEQAQKCLQPCQFQSTRLSLRPQGNGQTSQNL